MSRTLLFAVLMTLITTRLQAQATAPAATPAEGPLKVMIDGVEGIVQYRGAPDQAWQKATAGIELHEGAEIRTGPRSAVRMVIPPDQTITLDRLGTLQILRANFENGKIMTDLGMKYGRTRYDIEAEGRAHDAKLHSPSAVLAVRGTKVNLYDQPPFLPQATSLTGRAMFRDLKKQVSFGGPGAGKTKVNEQSKNSADFARNQTVADPHGQFSGRSEADNLLQLSLAGYGGNDFSNLGVLAFLDAARAGTFKGSVIGSLPIERPILFQMIWNGSPFSDVDLIVTSPRGEIVSFANQSVLSGGFFLGDPQGAGVNGVADDTGFGQEAINWPIRYPAGTYTVRAELTSGTTADVQVFAIDNGSVLKTIAGPTLTPINPVLEDTVTATHSTPAPGAAAARVAQATQKQTSTATPRALATRLTRARAAR